MSWTVETGSLVNGVGTESKSGLLSAISANGLVYAYAERSNPVDNTSSLDIKVRRKVGTSWQDFGNTIATSAFYTNAQLASVTYTQQISLSDDGQTMAFSNSGGGIGFVTVVQYNSTSNMWVLKGTGITGDGIGGPIGIIGYSVALSGDGSHLITGGFIGAGTPTATVYGFSTGMNNWVLQENLFASISDNIIAAALGINVAINANGTTVAAGHRNGIPSFSGNVRVWDKPSPALGQTYVVRPILDRNSGNFSGISADDVGAGVALNSTGNIVVIGAPDSNAGDGAVNSFIYNGVSWSDNGNLLQGATISGERFGEIVSISSNGQSILVSSSNSSNLATNAGYSRIYAIVGGTWTQIGATLGIATNNALNFFSDLAGSGRTIVQGSPGSVGGFGTVRVLSTEIIFTTPTQPVITRQVGQSPVSLNLSGTFVATGGGLAPITYTITGGTIAGMQSSKLGSFGTLTISNTSTGAYAYNPTNIPTTAGSYSDQFTIRATDGTTEFTEISFIVMITVFQTTPTFSLVPIATQGSVVKAAGGTTVVTSGLTGQLMVTPGSGTAASYGVTGGIVAGNDRFVDTVNGLFTIDSTTGSYTYQVDFGVIGNTITMYEESFTLSATSTTGARATTTYKVVFEIRPQMLLGQLSPSAGVITRNTNNQPGAISIVGLSGTIVPVVANAIGALSFSIDGGILPPSSFVMTAGGTLGNLFVNVVTGAYEFDPDSLNLPAVPGVYLDQFVIRVKDSNTPVQNEQTLIYNISATIFDTPIGLLPTFRDATTREIAGYWNFIVHDVTGTSNITSSGTITVPNTELLVIGQTETNSMPVRNPDGVLRQLLASAAYDRSNPADTLINVKNNTVDVLDTDNINGIQTRSMQLSRVQNSALQIFVAELSDVLSSQHLGFLLDRYRSNIGECVIVIYANDAVSPLPNATATAILNQVSQMISLGVRTIIGVMMAATLDPAISAEKTALQNAQAGFLNQIATVAGNASVTIQSVIVRYNSTTKLYQNVAGTGADPSTQPEIAFTVTGYSSFNLFGALSRITFIPQDSTNPSFRIVIKSINTSTKGATGDVIYGTIPTGTRSFISSRLFTDTTRTITAASAIVDIVGVNIAAGQIPSITITQGSTGKNVDQLKLGDVLYPSTFAFTRPTSARLLVSVVSGYKSANIIGTQLLLQIDDGVRLPNNPVFPVTVVAIVNRFNSNTLALANPAGTILESGFDYEVDVKDLEVSGAIASAGLELFTQFPRLGFVTLYFASSSTGAPIYNAYGRAAVKSITRS